jgi:4-amino-4-deoxy-L-arabinose transferase-like glycosyltransferase
VTTSTDIAPRKNADELLARIGWAALICATLYVCYFSHLGAIGFVGPDEPRYAWIARDMAETGDLVTPRLYGKPWFEKPPLYYWGAAICFKLFGVSEAAARLPSAISALLATLAMAWFAWRVYGAETARWLLLLLPTTVGMIGFSHAAATDMPFSAMLTIGMVCAAAALGLVTDESSRDAAQGAASLQGERNVARRRWLALILFGFFLGLAVLAKGPAGIILCGGAVFFWALFTKRWRGALRLFHPAAITAFCVTALPWYILCARRNPDFVRIFIIEHNFKRYLTPEFQHIQPLWFYVPVVLLALFPWTALLIGLVDLKAFTLSSGAPYFVCWTAFTILFFSLSQSKLPGYILPALAPLMLLSARGLTHTLKAGEKSIRWMCAGVGVSVSAMALVGLTSGLVGRMALDYALNRKVLDVADPIVVSTILALFVAVGALSVLPTLVLWLVGRRRIALFLAVVAPVIVMIIGTTYMGRVFDEIVSVRPAFRKAELVWPGLTRRNIVSYKLRRSALYAFNFYLGREIKERSSSENENVLVVTTPDQVLSLEQSGFPCSRDVNSFVVVVCDAQGHRGDYPPK